MSFLGILICVNVLGLLANARMAAQTRKHAACIKLREEALTEQLAQAKSSFDLFERQSLTFPRASMLQRRLDKIDKPLRNRTPTRNRTPMRGKLIRLRPELDESGEKPQ